MTRDVVWDRKLGYLRRYLKDLGAYAALDMPARRREHYAIERLLQLLCECAADLGLQHLKLIEDPLPTSYREIFQALEQRAGLAPDLAAQLIAACGMRNVLTHLYDSIDLERVVAAVDPAIGLYGLFADWCAARRPTG